MENTPSGRDHWARGGVPFVTAAGHQGPSDAKLYLQYRIPVVGNSQSSGTVGPGAEAENEMLVFSQYKCTSPLGVLVTCDRPLPLLTTPLSWSAYAISVYRQEGQWAVRVF